MGVLGVGALGISALGVMYLYIIRCFLCEYLFSYSCIILRMCTFYKHWLPRCFVKSSYAALA